MARAGTTTDVFNAIAERRRREVLDRLAAGERSVGELVDDLGLTQPQVSKHLKVLASVGLVRARQDGRRRLYRLDPGGLQAVHDWVTPFADAWNARLDRLDDLLTDTEPEPENEEHP